MSAFGEAQDTDNSWFDFSGRRFDGAYIYDRRLTQQFGGFIQGQYWFTNQWFINTVWGMQRSFGVDRSTTAQAISLNNPVGYKYAAPGNDQVKLWQG